MIRHSVVTARTVILAVSAALLLLVLGVAPPAAAEPATSVSYPAAATATRLTGYAFDRCDAPSAAAMKAWVGSRYRGVAIYIGGRNRTCDAQPNLTPAWVGAGLEGLAADPDLPGSPGPVRRPANAMSTSRPAMPPPRERRTRSPRSPRPGRWACCPAAPSTATWRTTTPPTRAAGRGAALRLVLDQGAAPGGLPVRHVRQPRLRRPAPGRARTTPPPTPGRTRCGSPAGTTSRA